MKNWICKTCWRRTQSDEDVIMIQCGCGENMELDTISRRSEPINHSSPISEHFRSISVAPMTAKELTAVLDSYIERYGDITITELLDKMEVEHLRLN